MKNTLCIKKFLLLSLTLITAQTRCLLGMINNELNSLQDNKKKTVLITMYGGLNGFAKEKELPPKKRGVSTRSFNGILNILEKGKTTEKNVSIEFREGLPLISDLKKYDQCIHIQPGGNMHDQYGRNIKTLNSMRELFKTFVDGGGYLVAICAGALLVSNAIIYPTANNNAYKSFDPSQEDPSYKQNSLYPHELRIPMWPGKDIFKDIFTLYTDLKHVTQYFGGPVFDEKDLKNDSWTVLDRAYFESTKKKEAIAIRKERVTLISPHFEFPEGNEESYMWLYKVIRYL